MDAIEIDGASGEGGGQILRTSLALAAVTGRTLRITRIRARRPKPGLMRQHLTAVNAAARVCNGHVQGAELGSQALSFVPGPIQTGNFEFAVGTAGSCTLVLQTVLPMLLCASGESRLVLRGGTHNPMAPPYPFLERAFLPLLERMGVRVRARLARHGFYPAGGGEVEIEISAAARLRPLDVSLRGAPVDAYVEALVAGLPADIASRELGVIGAALGLAPAKRIVRELGRNEGPGNAVIVTLVYEGLTEVVTAFGEKGRAAEAVARAAAEEALAYRVSNAAIGPHLADQLLIPMALAGEGRFTTTTPTAHFTSNAEVIERFLPVRITAVGQGNAVYAIQVSSIEGQNSSSGA